MKPIRIALIVLGLFILVLAAVFFWPEKPAEPPFQAPPEQAPRPSTSQPPVRYPLPEIEPAMPEETRESNPPLPELGQSDSFTIELLQQLFGGAVQKQLLAPQQFMRRTVLIIDALPGKDLPMQHLPLRSPLGSFQVAEVEGTQVIATENFSRYTPYVELAEAVPVRQLSRAYLRVYPLLEEAYRELGHPKGYFHDRMIEVLDHLLATPQVKGPIPLEAHIARYRYADPKLEALSAGQKTLVRMGWQNADRIKKVLQDLRDQLTAPSQKP